MEKRFRIRNTSFNELIRSLERATYGLTDTEAEKLCAKHGQWLEKKKPKKALKLRVEAMRNAGCEVPKGTVDCSDFNYFADYDLLDDVNVHTPLSDTLPKIILARREMVLTAFERIKLWETAACRLDKSRDISNTKFQVMIDRLIFVTDPDLKKVPFEKRIIKISERFQIPPTLAEEYTYFSKFTHCSLGILAFLRRPKFKSEQYAIGRPAQLPDTYFLERRVLQLYPIRRAIDFSQQIWVRENNITKKALTHLSTCAILMAIGDAEQRVGDPSRFATLPIIIDKNKSLQATPRSLVRYFQRNEFNEEYGNPRNANKFGNGIKKRMAYEADPVKALKRFAEDLEYIKAHGNITPREGDTIKALLQAAENGYYPNSKLGKSLKDYFIGMLKLKPSEYSRIMKVWQRIKKRLKS